MSHVVLLSQDGIRCALPASQVSGAREASDEPEIRLWRRTSESREAGSQRALLVETPTGRRRIRCSDVRFGQLAEETMRALPELLRELLRLPHVVGLTESEDAVLWLVDLQRWEDE